MKSILIKSISLVMAASFILGGAVFVHGDGYENDKITARHYDGIKIDGEIDDAWQYAEKKEIDTAIGDCTVTATLRVLYGDRSINWVPGGDESNKCLYVLVEVDKHGKAVEADDGVYAAFDLLDSTAPVNTFDCFGIGLVGVTPDGEGNCTGWMALYRGTEFITAAKQTAFDKWTVELAFDIVDANRTSRPYKHGGEDGFGLGTEFAFSVVVCEDYNNIFAVNETVSWKTEEKKFFFSPQNRVVIGDDVTEAAPKPLPIAKVIGDVNGDGKVKGNDATLLLKYLSGWNVKIVTDTADCKRDCRIKGSDVTLLLKYLSGWNVKMGVYENFGNVLILGDSISTFEGWIPDGYANAYSAASLDEFGIDSVEQTWWHMLITETGSTLVRNDSFSGSCLGYTSYNQVFSPWNSFLDRFDNLVKANYFEENPVDTVFIFGGTNDLCAQAPLGKIKFDGITDEDLKSTLPATAVLLDHINNALPNARVVFIVYDRMKGEIGQKYARVAKHYGAEFVQLSEIDQYGIHPTNYGMYQIKEELLKLLG